MPYQQQKTKNSIFFLLFEKTQYAANT